MTEANRIAELVQGELDRLPIVDIHTHLFDPGMGDLLLSGVDELLTYHYHVAELFRMRPDLEPAAFFALSTAERADLVWQELFVNASPLSEVGKGVVTLFSALGLDPHATTLGEARAYFESKSVTERVDDAFRLANISEAYMTNDPLDPAERTVWERGFEQDPRFVAALRLDSAIMEWPKAVPALRELGYAVSETIDDATVGALRRYLVEWYGKLGARYMAVSLPPRLDYPESGATWLQLLTRAVIPAARDCGSPVALMIGVRRQVNPRLELAGDSSGITDVESIERLANDFPDIQFWITLLAREGQHGLCVAARKFANIRPFGCWWFLNVPSTGKEMTAMRLDLLGPSFVPQHSDARVLEQVIFKWRRSRRWLGEVFADHYSELAAAGFDVTVERVRRDLQAMLQVRVGT